jgi:hypothetical protein
MDMGILWLGMVYLVVSGVSLIGQRRYAQHLERFGACGVMAINTGVMQGMFSSSGRAMIRLLSWVTLAIALVMACGQATASCIGFAPTPGENDPLRAEIKWEVSLSAAVFTGTVTAMEYIPVRREFVGERQMLAITLAADVWWKGEESREVRLDTDTYKLDGGYTTSGAEEFHYEVGRKYLVYAYKSRDGLQANSCTRTKPIESAASDIEVLDALKAE